MDRPSDPEGPSPIFPKIEKRVGNHVFVKVLGEISLPEHLKSSWVQNNPFGSRGNLKSSIWQPLLCKSRFSSLIFGRTWHVTTRQIRPGWASLACGHPPKPGYWKIARVPWRGAGSTVVSSQTVGPHKHRHPRANRLPQGPRGHF